MPPCPSTTADISVRYSRSISATASGGRVSASPVKSRRSAVSTVTRRRHGASAATSRAPSLSSTAGGKYADSRRRSRRWRRKLREAKAVSAIPSRATGPAVARPPRLRVSMRRGPAAGHHRHSMLLSPRNEDPSARRVWSRGTRAASVRISRQRLRPDRRWHRRRRAHQPRAARDPARARLPLAPGPHRRPRLPERDAGPVRGAHAAHHRQPGSGRHRAAHVDLQRHRVARLHQAAHARRRPCSGSSRWPRTPSSASATCG